jgi:hypothetical protein
MGSMLVASHGTARPCCAMCSPLKIATVSCESQKIHVDMQSNSRSDPIPPAGVSVDVECDDV